MVRNLDGEESEVTDSSEEDMDYEQASGIDNFYLFHKYLYQEHAPKIHISYYNNNLDLNRAQNYYKIVLGTKARLFE